MRKVILIAALIGTAILVEAQRDNPWDIIPHQPSAAKTTTFGHDPDGSSWVMFEVDPNAPATNELWYTLTNIYTGETVLVGPILGVQGKPAAPVSLRIGP